MNIKQKCKAKTRSAAAAAAMLKNGNRIFVGSGCGEPQHLIHSMVSHRQLEDIMIFQMLSYSFQRYLKDPDFLRRFSLKLFFVTIAMRQAAFDGKIDYIPVYLSEIPRLFRNRQIILDVAFWTWP